MERLGNNQEKKPENSVARLRKFGRKMLDGYIEGMSYGAIWAPVPGFAVAQHYAEKERLTAEQTQDSLEEDDEHIIRGEN